MPSADELFGMRYDRSEKRLPVGPSAGPTIQARRSRRGIAHSTSCVRQVMPSNNRVQWPRHDRHATSHPPRTKDTGAAHQGRQGERHTQAVPYTFSSVVALVVSQACQTRRTGHRQQLPRSGWGMPRVGNSQGAVVSVWRRHPNGLRSVGRSMGRQSGVRTRNARGTCESRSGLRSQRLSRIGIGVVGTDSPRHYICDNAYDV